MKTWIDFAKEQADRFWKKVQKTDHCWLWIGATDKNGYGQFSITLPRQNGKEIQKHVRAHRLAHLLSGGILLPGESVLHSCDVPACCKPCHLHPGDQLLNRRECVNRERQAIGSTHGLSKLTEEHAMQIIFLRDHTELSALDIAGQFGVSESTVYKIGKLCWRHLK